jgi:hypothetical protein
MKKIIAAVLMVVALLAIFFAFMILMEPVFAYLKDFIIAPVLKPILKDFIRPIFIIIPDFIEPVSNTTFLLNVFLKFSLFIIFCWGALKILGKILEYAVKKLRS